MSKQVTKEAPSLNDIIQFELPALLRRQHLNRDVSIGFVGDRGDGKSVGAAILATLDYMVQNEPCHSHNMQISVGFDVDVETAGKYGMQPGKAMFSSNPLDMPKFLYTDTDDYAGGVAVVDEINIALADARRAMSNQNLAADDVGQQLRKFKSAFIFTCIHEMFVDNRIRDMADIFIRTRDTALSPEGLASKKPPGLEFEWTIYPMTRKLTGETYADTGKTITAVVNGKMWWGVVDTYQRQKRQKFSISTTGGGVYANLDVKESPILTEQKAKWGWLYEDIKNLHDKGYEKIHSEELWEYLRLDERGIFPTTVGPQLRAMGIKMKMAPKTMGGQYYLIDQFDLEKGINLTKTREREAVLV